METASRRPEGGSYVHEINMRRGKGTSKAPPHPYLELQGLVGDVPAGHA
jgi:hypothetical protein